MYNGHIDVDAIIGLTVCLMIISVRLIQNCEKSSQNLVVLEQCADIFKQNRKSTKSKGSQSCV